MMRSTHTATVEVIAGVLPMDLWFRELSLKFLTKGLCNLNQILRTNIRKLSSIDTNNPLVQMCNSINELGIPHMLQLLVP